MSFVLSLLAQIVHIVLMLAAAPTVAGVLDWIGARLGGRTGPTMLRPWHDLARLWRKTPLAMESASVVSRLAPAVALGATLSAAALVPSFSLGMTLAPLADVLVVVSLLALARIAGGLAALDCGAPLPALAAQSGCARAVLAEPALMLSVVSLALIGGNFNLDLIIAQQRDGLLLPAAASAVALTAMLALLFAEASAPDDGLQQMASGTDLAILRITVWLRRLVWIDLIGALFLPIGMAGAGGFPLGWLIGIASWAIKLAVFTVGLSALQTMLGRVPHRGLSDLIGVAALLALLATIMVLASTGTV